MQQRPIRILHLEDNSQDAFLVKAELKRSDIPFDLRQVSREQDFILALRAGDIDLILCDHGLPGFSGEAALELAQRERPKTPFVFVSGADTQKEVDHKLRLGAVDFVSKRSLSRLPSLLHQLPKDPAPIDHDGVGPFQIRSWKRLVAAVQELSLARNLDSVMKVVRLAAREITGADGASFVLRDGDQCYYAEENAIAPLWKGQRFPMSACISGWAMQNKQPAVIEDIYADPRIPVDAYRPTFVKSLVVVPIRSGSPIGAIGNYWADRHLASAEEIEILQALANTTSVALENIHVYETLERRVQQRTLQLEAANRELEAFTSSVSHDLRNPLQRILAFANLLGTRSGASLNEQGRDYLANIESAAHDMATLITDLLRLAQFAEGEMKCESVDLSALAEEVIAGLRLQDPGRRVEVTISDDLVVAGDRGLLRVVIENLVGNAWKYTSKKSAARIEIGLTGNKYFIRDDGAGFDMNYAGALFAPFKRLHAKGEFEGNGVGLATVRRIIHRHEGRIWAEAEPEKGATFYFTLGSKIS